MATRKLRGASETTSRGVTANVSKEAGADSGAGEADALNVVKSILTKFGAGLEAVQEEIKSLRGDSGSAQEEIKSHLADFGTEMKTLRAEFGTEMKKLRAEFGEKLDTMNDRLTDVVKRTSALEDKVMEIKRDTAARIDEAERRISDTEDALNALNPATKRIAYLESKLNEVENRSRRNNLRLFGIREGAEGQQSLFDFINGKLPQWLGLNPEKAPTLELVHRVPASAKPGQNRAILVRFVKAHEKEFVYRESRRRDILHDGVKLAFVQDLSAETVRIRRGFNSVVKLFIDIGAFRGFQYNPCKLRVVYNGKIHLFSTPQEAEDFYKSIPQPQ